MNLDQYVKHAIKERKSPQGMGIIISGLMLAAMEGDVYLAQILISHGCNLNITDHNNRNAIFYAIENTHNNSDNRDKTSSSYFEIINLLINSGINLNQIDKEGHSPLTLSVLKCEKEIVRILLNNNADVNHQVMKDGNTPLHYAVNLNKPDLIQMLLLRKPDLGIQNKNGQTPMEIATSLSRTEVYQILAEEYNLRERENLNKKEEVVILTIGNGGNSSSHPSKGGQNNLINQSGQNTQNTLNNQSNLSKSPISPGNNTGLSVSENLNGTMNENLSSEEQVYNDEESNISNKMNNLHLNAKFMSQVGQSSTNNQYNTVPVSHQNLNMNVPMNNQQFNMNNTSNYHQQNSQMQMMNSHMHQSNLSNYHSQFTQQGLQGQANTNLHQNQNTTQNFSQNNNLHSPVPNINININNLTHHNNMTQGRTGIPFTQKFTKNAKLQKLRYLQESRQFAEQHGRTIKDKTFRFPSNNIGTNIEIPFSFQTNPDGRLSNLSNSNQQGPKSQRNNPNQQLHTFIKIQSTPVLHIDISDEGKQDHFILTSQIEELKMNGNNQMKRISQLELDLNSTVEEVRISFK
jgi:ankyrin repeat protein